MSTFTEADKRKLEALKEKQKQAKQIERNEQKTFNKLCQKYFNLTSKEIEKLIKNPTENSSKSNEFFEKYWTLQKQVERLMVCMNKQPNQFEQYVEYREKMAAEKTTETDANN